MKYGMLTINEIFHSIQGESTYAGAPVRVRAPDRVRPALRLVRHAVRLHRGPEDDRSTRCVAEVAAFGCPLVEITGGEPLLQDDVYPLMAALLARGLTVLLETGGHISLDRVPDGVVKIVDVKCPGSGESARNHWPNLDLLRPADEVKFVIQDRADYEFARDVVDRHGLAATVRGRALLAGARRARAAGPGRVDPRRPAAGAAAAAGAQVHLGGPCPRRLSRAAEGRRPAERRPRLVHGRRHRARGGLRALRADRRVRPAPRRRARGRPAGRRAPSASRATSSSQLDLVGLRRVVADRRRRRAEGPRHRRRRHPVDLRAGAQHRVPVAGPGVGGGARRARHRHRRQRRRLLRLSRLPAGVHRGVRADGRARDEGGRRRRALPHPHAAHQPDRRPRSSGAGWRSASTTA